MLTICSSNIDLHTASHNFSIETRELWERPGGKFASFPSAGNWGNASVHAVFDGILLTYDGETKNCNLICINFHGDCPAWCVCQMLLYS